MTDKTLKELLRYMCEKAELQYTDVAKKRKSRVYDDVYYMRLIFTRHAKMRLASYIQIGRILKAHRTSVMYMDDRYDELYKINDEFRRMADCANVYMQDRMPDGLEVSSNRFLERVQLLAKEVNPDCRGNFLNTLTNLVEQYAR